MASRIQSYIDSMTPERILQLASRPQGFSVSRYRWRDEPIANRCAKLLKDGKLRRKCRDQDTVTYERAPSYQRPESGKETPDV